MRSPRSLALGAAALIAVGFAACGGPGSHAPGASSSGPATLTVAYWTSFDTPGTNATPDLVKAAAAELAAQHPGTKVVLDPIITDSESTYYAKIDLAQRSSATAPDVVMEDSFLIGSDASAGYIQPLPQLATWSGWSKFPAAMRSIVTYNGQLYGVMNSTDVQLIYYDAALFRKAGLPVPWQPHSFADIVSAAKALKTHDPGVTPAWLYTGTPTGEASSFRGFEVFLDGTHDRLFDPVAKKWETSGPGFTATWNFLAAMRAYEEPESDWSSPSAEATVDLNMIPQQQVGMVFDGSWVSTFFAKGGLKPWPGFFSTFRAAKFPTDGLGGYTNQSGGFAWAVARLSKYPTLAVDLIEDMSSPANLAAYDAKDGNLPPRSDAVTQPAWVQANKIDPMLTFASSLVAETNYRPNVSVYPQVSNEIAALTGDISSGSMTASQAESAYAARVAQIVGSGNIEAMKS